MQFKTTRAVSQKVIREFCPPPADGRTVKVLKDASGNIGGYIVNLPELDSEVTFLDALGNELTVFHIFDPDEKKRQASAIIEPLKNKFPLEEQLICP